MTPEEKKLRHSKYHREVWYPRNKNRRMELNNAWRKKRTEDLRTIKSLKGCLICDEKEACCLDFHHLDDSKKDFNLAQVVTRSMEKILKEIDKCVVVCSNCHRKIHAGIISLPL